jgi:tetratricopeptide (TPR) repeat protein
MDKEQRKLWRKLMAVPTDAVASQLYVARLYTRRYPKDMYGWIVLAGALAPIASYEEAMLALRTAKKLCPKKHLDFVYAQFGHTYKDKGDYRRAENWYRKAVEAKEVGRNFVFLGTSLARQGRYREAKRCHRQAIKIGSEVTDEAYLNLGLILRAEGKYEEALECFERAIEIDPRYALAKRARKDMIEVLKIRGSI